MANDWIVWSLFLFAMRNQEHGLDMVITRCVFGVRSVSMLLTGRSDCESNPRLRACSSL